MGFTNKVHQRAWSNATAKYHGASMGAGFESLYASLDTHLETLGARVMEIQHCERSDRECGHREAAVGTTGVRCNTMSKR